jgi:hypothetical protein
MAKTNSEPEHIDVKRHWCPKSEQFAGGDALASMINGGWQLKAVVSREYRQLSGTRQIVVYLIELHRNGKKRQVRVMCNPYVTRMLAAHELQGDASYQQ